MKPSTDAQNDFRRDNLNGRELARAAALIALLVPVSMLLNGYSFIAGTNEYSYIFLERLSDPSSYPGDEFADSFTRFPTHFWHVVHWVSELFPLESAALLLHTLTRFLLLAAYFYLGYAIGNGSLWTARAALLLATFGPPMWFGYVTITSYAALHHTGFAFPYLVFAIAFAIRGRFATAMVFLSIAAFFNVLYAAYDFIFVMVAYVAAGDIKRRLPRMAIFVALAALGVCLYAFASGQMSHNFLVSSPDDAVRFDIIYHVTPYHTKPHWQFAENAIPTVVYFLMAAGLVAALWRIDPRSARFQLGSLLYSAALLWGWCFLAYIWRRGSLMALQPSRGNDLWYSFVAIGFLELVRRQLAAGSRWAGATGALAIAIFAYQSQEVLDAWRWQPLAVALAGIAAFELGRRRRPSLAPHLLLGAAGAIVAATLLQTCAVRYGQNRNLTGLQRIAEYENVESAPYYDLALWARGELPTDATFFVPPSWRFWRLLSRRTTHILFDDSLAAYHDVEAAVLWTERMAELGINSSSAGYQRHNKAWADMLVGRLAPAERRAIADKHGIDYWIVAEDQEAAAPVIRSDAGFRVLDMR